MIATAVMIVGVGLIGTVSATVAAWFVGRHSEPGAEPADVGGRVEPFRRHDRRPQALLLDRLDELAVRQGEIAPC